MAETLRDPTGALAKAYDDGVADILERLTSAEVVEAVAARSWGGEHPDDLDSLSPESRDLATAYVRSILTAARDVLSGGGE